MAKKTTQREDILDFIDKHGSITRADAFKLGIANFTARMSEIQQDGIAIKKTDIWHKNKKGQQTHHRVYARGSNEK